MSCDAQNAQKTNKAQTLSPKLEVYYFHYTRRCKTCVSVEATAKQALAVLYPEKIKSGEYTFKTVNLDDESNKAIAEKLDVGGQTLLVVSGNQKIDITDKGFLHSHDLEKMKLDVKTAVSQALKN
jgi:hypothetical protein